MKPVPGFEGIYSITEDGLIWSHLKENWIRIEIRDTQKLVMLYKNGNPFRSSIDKILKEIRENEYKKSIENIKRPKIVRIE